MSGNAPKKSLGGDPREQSGAVAEPPGKVWFRNLDEAVIEPDRCIQCASCVAACPSDSIGIDAAEGRPTLVRMCTGCSRCWDFCPRSGLRYERVLDLTNEERAFDEPKTYAVRAADDDGTTVGQDGGAASVGQDGGAASVGQDGGAVTALLLWLLDSGAIDAALVARERDDEPFRGEAVLATSRADLLAAAGSTYTQTMGLGRLSELIEAAKFDTEDPRIALVGTPCVIQGASALERYGQGDVDPIVLTIALMCTRSFDHGRLTSTLAEHGVDPTAIDALDVTDGVLYAFDDDEAVIAAEPVESFDAAALRGCGECTDFVGDAADISAGSVGSEAGYTTLVVRTPRGERAFTAAASVLEYSELDDTAALSRIASWNERRAKSVLPRSYDPTGSIGISYEAHRDAYDDTDREPKPLNPARVHQYEEWC